MALEAACSILLSGCDPAITKLLDGVLAVRYGFKQLATPVASNRARRQFLNEQGAPSPRN